MGESWSSEEGSGCCRDGGRGGGEEAPPGLVSGHGAAVWSPALEQMYGAVGECDFFSTSVLFAPVRANARTGRE
jgi:hypothetical protein